MTVGGRGGISVRLVGWCLVALGGTSLRIALKETTDGFGLAILAALVGMLLVEAVRAGLRYRDVLRDGAPLTVAERPADGVVEVIPMVGVADVAVGPWRRFVAFDPVVPRSARPRRWFKHASPVDPPLRGTVALISVFVGRHGRAWTDREIESAHEALREVGVWLEYEASRWLVPLNVGLAATYFQADDPLDLPVEVAFVAEGEGTGPLEANAAVKAVAAASRVATQLGCEDLADLVTRINPGVAAAAHVWLWHLKEQGRSYAIPAQDRVGPGVGLAICYAREASFPEPLHGQARVDPTTVAHELMHLFGATDKYGISLDGFPPGSVPRRDIMILDQQSLTRLRIGRLTANEVGWQVGWASAPVRKQKPVSRHRPRYGRG